MHYRPIEMNVIEPSEGKGIYVYDLKIPCANNKVNKDILTRYDVRAIHWKKLVHLGWCEFKDALLNKIKKS